MVQVQSAAGGVPPGRLVSAAGLATGGGSLAADRTITVTAATQADQETGSSTSVAVTPGVQHFHDSAAKCWGKANGAGTSLLASYNITSITDNGTGDITYTIATDFSSTDWGFAESVAASAARLHIVNTISAGAMRFKCFDTAFAAIDPSAYGFVGFGDLA